MRAAGAAAEEGAAMTEQMQPDREERMARLEAADRAGQYLHQVLEVGQYMLMSGGEVSRVEDSLRRMCRAFGAQRVEVLTITASIVATMYAPEYGAVTQSRRVTGQQYDLSRLERLNALSRLICREHLSAEEIASRLESVLKQDLYPFPVQIFTYVMISASFCLFFGGSWRDAVASGLIGIVLKFLDRTIRRREVTPFFPALLCSMLGGLLNVIIAKGLCKKFNTDLKEMAPFHKWQLSRSFHKGSLILVAGALIISFTNITNVTAIMMAISLIVIGPYALMGLCFLVFSFKVRRKGRGVIIASSVMMVMLFPYSLYGLCLMGLADRLMGLRRRAGKTK